LPDHPGQLLAVVRIDRTTVAGLQSG
jgi:hypothetical protein